MKIHRRWKLLTTCVLIVALLLVSACAKGEDGPASTESEGEKATKVALLLPGSRTDGSWNESGYNGLMRLKDKGFEVNYKEEVALEDIEESFYNFAELGYDLVIGHGFEFGEPALRVTESFPDTKFFIVGKPPTEGIDYPDGIAFFDRFDWEGFFVIGTIAAQMTKTKTVGYVGGMEIPIQIMNMNAFIAGVKHIDPTIKALGVLAGTYEDAALGNETAQALIDSGADFIAQSADSTGVGVIEACSAAGVWTTGYSMDQSHLAPDNIITSMVIDLPRAIEVQGERVRDGKWVSGVMQMGVETGVISLAPLHKSVPDEVVESAKDITQKIADGTIVVPKILDPPQ